MSTSSDEPTTQRGSREKPITRAAFLKLGVAVGAGSLMAPLAGCGSGSEKATTTGQATSGGGAAKKIERSVMTNQVTTLSNPFFVGWTEGVKQCASALGTPLNTITHDGNASKQLAQVASVKNSGGKMLFGAAATQGVIPGLVRACENAGIYYANLFDLPPWFTPLDVGEHYVGHYVQDPVNAYDMAKLLFEEMGGKGTFIHVPGQPGNSSDIYRTAGVLKAMKEFPDIKRVASSPGNWTPTDGRKAFSAAIQSTPDYGGIFAQNDGMIIGIQSVIQERRLELKPMVGIDGDKQNIQFVMQGKQLATSATIAGVDAAFAAIAVFDALNGWKPKPAERLTFIASSTVTKDNAKEYYEKFFQEKTLPFDWVKMSRTLSPKDWNPQAKLTPIDPREYWSAFPQKTFKLNAEYSQAIEAGQLDEVRAQYEKAYTDGPFKTFDA